MSKTTLSLVLSALAVTTYTRAQGDCPTVWKCYPTETAPTLDGELTEWASVKGVESTLRGALTGTEYDAGKASFKCLYDETNIYLALSIPGFYSFDADDNHLCAAIATMTKIGASATFYNMGGCPEAIMPDVECNATVVDKCDAHRVDVGAHWELRTTEQGVAYPIGLANPNGGGSDTAVQAQELLPTGDDAVANKDDEYAVGSYCRLDDDDDKAGNEWAGAWKHTNAVDGELGSYVFELSRLLTTQSTLSDAQMKAGDTVQFGVAFWDPSEQSDGWTDAGHYVTGCGTSWIDLELVEEADGTSSAGKMTLLATVVSIMLALIF